MDVGLRRAIFGFAGAGASRYDSGVVSLVFSNRDAVRSIFVLLDGVPFLAESFLFAGLNHGSFEQSFEQS
jgi:hypothetical protein